MNSARVLSLDQGDGGARLHYAVDFSEHPKRCHESIDQAAFAGTLSIDEFAGERQFHRGWPTI